MRDRPPSSSGVGRGGSRSVQVAAVNFHDATGSKSSGDRIVEKMRRDLIALNFDVGLG
jgi:hypothetical protein